MALLRVPSYLIYVTISLLLLGCDSGASHKTKTNRQVKKYHRQSALISNQGHKHQDAIAALRKYSSKQSVYDTSINEESSIKSAIDFAFIHGDQLPTLKFKPYSIDDYDYDNEEDFASVEIKNKSTSAVKFLFYGPSKKQIQIGPYQQASIRLQEGIYKVATFEGLKAMNYAEVRLNKDIYYCDYGSYREQGQTRGHVPNSTEWEASSYSTKGKINTIQYPSIYSNEKYDNGYGKRVGAICRDGWRSYATGRGACSHHGGVAYWLYE